MTCLTSWVIALLCLITVRNPLAVTSILIITGWSSGQLSSYGNLRATIVISSYKKNSNETSPAKTAVFIYEYGLKMKPKENLTMNSLNINPTLTCAIRRAFSVIGVSAALAAFAQGASAACTYSIDNEWGSGFVASITITNDTNATISDWRVSWQYNSNRMSSGWNANFPGTNPHTATSMGWNGSHPPGPAGSFSPQGDPHGVSVGRPTVTGSGCGGAASSTPVSSSSAPRSSASSGAASSTPSTLVLQESQNGFCRVDGTIDNNHAGFTGSGFANTDNVQGAAVVWAVQAASSGPRTLTFRMANGGTANRNASLLVNGGSNGNHTVSLPVTGAWDNWQTVSIQVDLVQGNNVLQLSSL